MTMDGVRLEQEDSVLVAEAKASPAAFTALYRRYVGPIYRYCYVRLGTSEEAEDATSKVFVKALAGLAGCRGDRFAAWLFRIARNVVIDTYRARRPAEELDPAGEYADPAPGPEAEMLAKAEAEALRAALGRLSEAQRTAIELQLAGWSGLQIAQVLDKSPQACRMLRFRALRRLRRLLDAATPQSEEVGDDCA